MAPSPPPRRSRSGLVADNRTFCKAKKLSLGSIKCTSILLAALAAMDALVSFSLSRFPDMGDTGLGGSLAGVPHPARRKRPSVKLGSLSETMGGVSAAEEKPYLTTTPLVVFASNRPKYLDKTLTALLEHHPVNLRSRKKYGGPIVGSPVIVSEDGDMKRVVDKFRGRFESIGIPFFTLTHEKVNSPEANGGAYRDLCAHYGWALERVFSGAAYDPGDDTHGEGTNSESPPSPPQPNHVIIMEEDVQIAPDFFPLLASLIPLLDADESLMAASAFNDNGKRRLVGDPRRLVRSDFFPGLGWVMPRRIWDDLGPQWPGLYWDDWMRQAGIRKGRQVIRPEVPRTFHFGVKGGASRNINAKQLTDIALNTKDVRWEDKDLSHLHNDAYREKFYKRVMRAQAVDTNSTLTAVKDSDVRLVYRNYKEFVRYAKHFQLYDDERGGIARSAYENIVDFRPWIGNKKGPAKYLVFIAPPFDVIKKNFKAGEQQTPEEFAKTLLLNPEKNPVDIMLFQ